MQQLDYLVTIAESPTWRVAADHLGVTPSALSQGVAELERRFGRPLFERVGRRRQLAPDAQPVLDYARSVIAATRDLGRWLQATGDGELGQLRVGMIDAAAIGHYSDALRSFRTDRADVDLRLVVGPSAQLLDQLIRNELDLAVIVQPPETPTQVTTTELITEALAVYGPEGATDDPPERWGPWVSFPSSSHTRQMIDQHLTALGAPVDVVAESHQPEVLREMVRLGIGWTVLPVIQAEAEPRPLIRAQAAPLFERTLVAARRSEALPNPRADQLLARLDHVRGEQTR